MSAEEFFKKVVDGVVDKLSDPNATYGLRADTILNLREVFPSLNFVAMDG